MQAIENVQPGVSRLNAARHPANSAPAEEAFLTAIAVAKRQGTRSFELRAALSLAKLYRESSRPADAPRRSRTCARRLFADAGNAGDWRGAGIGGRHRRQCAFVPRGRCIAFRIAQIPQTTTSSDAIAMFASRLGRIRPPAAPERSV